MTATVGERLAGAVVVDAQIAPLHQVASYNGTLARVIPTYASPAAEGPASLVAKLVPENARIRELGTTLGIYLREAALYRNIGERTGVRTPRLIGLAADQSDGASALLLEDLSQLRTGLQSAGYAVSEAETSILQFARMHAAWWNSDELTRLDWLPAWNEPAMVRFVVAAYAQIWPAFVSLFGDVLPRQAVELGARLADAVDDLMNAIAAPPFTLVHGDARHENLLFEADASAAPYVVDWQFVARGRGVMDVAYYLTQSGSPELCATHERALVERYHDALCAEGVTQYSAARCWEDYRRFAYYGFVYPVFAASLADPDNAAQRAAVEVILERAVAAMLRLDVAEFA